MEGEEEMISDFIPDVRVDVPMPRCRQPKPRLQSANINIPRLSYVFFQRTLVLSV